MNGQRLTVVVQAAVDSEGLPAARTIRRWVRAAVGGRMHGELTVRIVDESESADLNARYRGREGSTNVLAFEAAPDLPPNLAEEGGDPRPAGDIVVCAPVVDREAEAQGKARDAHWAHIVIHGALHLLGFDHEAQAEAERMEAAEREILAGFGFADPYA